MRGDGEHSLEYRSVDRAGHVETARSCSESTRRHRRFPECLRGNVRSIQQVNTSSTRPMACNGMGTPGTPHSVDKGRTEFSIVAASLARSAFVRHPAHWRLLCVMHWPFLLRPSCSDCRRRPARRPPVRRTVQPGHRRHRGPGSGRARTSRAVHRRTRRRQPEPADDRELPGRRRPGQHGRSGRPVRVRAEAPHLRNRQSRGGQGAAHGQPAAGLRPQRQPTSASSRRSGIRARC